MEFKVKKIIRNIVICLVLVCCLSPFLVGCDYTTYPADFDVRWESADPEVVLEYRRATAERPYQATEYVIVDGEPLFVQVSYGPAHEFLIRTEEKIDLDVILMRGRWEMSKDRNELVLYVSEDDLFHGAYEEIHFTRKALE